MTKSKLPKQTHKVCTACKKDLLAEAFNVRKQTGRLYSECKGCARIRIRKSTKKFNLRHVYNISLEEYNAMVEKQQGLCAICGKPEKVFNQYGLRNLCVDHNHETGKVRALLCSHCNHMIGNAKENIETLANAIKYILYWS